MQEQVPVEYVMERHAGLYEVPEKEKKWVVVPCFPVHLDHKRL